MRALSMTFREGVPSRFGVMNGLTFYQRVRVLYSL